MSRTSQALKRLGVAGVVVATIGAGVPAFFTTAASAAPTGVTLSPDTQSTPEDTCQQYTATVTFDNTTGADTATVDVSADPRANEDVEFCALSGTNNGTSTNLGGGTNPYPAGNANGTTTTFRSGGGPGVTENREFTVTGTSGSNTGTVTFGVVSDRAGTVDVTAFLENTNASTGNGVRDTGEPGDTSVATYTLGGTEGVESLDAEPETGAATQGQAYVFTATIRDAGTGGKPISGVTPVFTVISGPDANIAITTPCNAPTDQNGTTTCTLANGGTTPGTDTIRVFVNQNDPDNNPATNDATPLFNTGEPFDDITVVFSSPQAAGTTLTLTCTSVKTNLQGDACDNPITENTEVFTALVKNASGTPLSGVPVRFTVNDSAADANNVPAGTSDTETITPQCTTGTDGTCTATLTNPRVTGGAAGTAGESFVVTAAVEVSSGSGNCPGINNVPNNSVCDSATKRFRTPGTGEARTLTLTPETQTVPAQGGVARITASVVDRSGIAVPGVNVFFTEDGPGRFFAANSANTAVCTTGTAGTCAVEMSTTTAEGAGTNNVTATIATNPGANNEECEQTANNTGPFGAGPNNTGNNQPGAPAGDCDDTAVVNFGAATASPTATATGTGGPGGGRGTLSTSTPDIQPNIQGILTATGLTSGAQYDLMCYSRPSTTYFVARQATVSQGGSTLEFRILPGTNTRCYVRPVGNDALASNSVVINVHTTLSLSAVRTGVRTYIFQGRNLPRRSGQLITLYRIANGQEIRTSNLVTDASGIYRVTRTFTGTGTFQFRVRTSQTLTNAPGASNIITVTVH